MVGKWDADDSCEVSSLKECYLCYKGKLGLRRVLSKGKLQSVPRYLKRLFYRTDIVTRVDVSKLKRRHVKLGIVCRDGSEYIVLVQVVPIYMEKKNSLKAFLEVAEFDWNKIGV